MRLSKIHTPFQTISNYVDYRCIGVFDTVGSVGLPEELTHRSEKIKSIFGFRDKLLGEHIARAYQALALNERRADFASH